MKKWWYTIWNNNREGQGGSVYSRDDEILLELYRHTVLASGAKVKNVNCHKSVAFVGESWQSPEILQLYDRTGLL